LRAPTRDRRASRGINGRSPEAPRSREADYADCANQGKTWGIGFNVMAAQEMKESIYQECMVGRGWRLSDKPGSSDREIPPNYGH